MFQGRIVQLFEKNTYSVVNIFDVTLRPQLKMTGVVEVLFLSMKRIPLFNVIIDCFDILLQSESNCRYRKEMALE